MPCRQGRLITILLISLILLSLPTYALHAPNNYTTNEVHTSRIGWIVGVFKDKGTIRLVANSSTWVFSELSGSIVGVYVKPVYLSHLNYTKCVAPGIACVVDYAVDSRILSNGGVVCKAFSKKETADALQQLGIVWFSGEPVDIMVDNYYKINRGDGFAQIDFYQVWRIKYVPGLGKEDYLGIILSWRLYFNNIMLYRIKLSKPYMIKPLVIASTPYDYWNPVNITKGYVGNQEYYIISDPKKKLGLLITIVSPSNTYKVVLDPSESGFLFGPSTALRIEYKDNELPVSEVRIGFQIVNLTKHTLKDIEDYVVTISKWFNEGSWPNDTPTVPRWLKNTGIEANNVSHNIKPVVPLILKHDGFYDIKGNKVTILGLNAGNPVDRIYSKDYSVINETVLQYYAVLLRRFGYNGIRLIVSLPSVYDFKENKPYQYKIENIVKTIKILGDHGIYVTLTGGKAETLRDNRNYETYKNVIISVFNEIIERLISEHILHYVVYIDIVNEKEGIRSWDEFRDLITSFKRMLESLGVNIPVTISLCDVNEVANTDYIKLVDIIDVHLYGDNVVSNAYKVASEAYKAGKPWIVGETGIWYTGYPIKEYRLEMLPNGTVTRHNLPVYLWYPPWRITEITFKRLLAPIAMSASGVFWYGDTTLYYSSLVPTPLMPYVGQIYKFTKRYLVNKTYNVTKRDDGLFIIQSNDTIILLDDFTSGTNLYSDVTRKYIVRIPNGIYKLFTPKYDSKKEMYFIDNTFILDGLIEVYSVNPLVLIRVNDVEVSSYYKQLPILVISAMPGQYFLYDYHALLNAMGLVAYTTNKDIPLSLLKQYLDLVNIVVIPGGTRVAWAIEAGTEEWYPQIPYENWREIIERVYRGYTLILLGSIYEEIPYDIFSEVFKSISINVSNTPHSTVRVNGLGVIKLHQPSPIDIKISRDDVDILGWFEDGSPAIIKFRYGVGTIIYVAFDWYNIKPLPSNEELRNIYVRLTPIKKENGWSVSVDEVILPDESRPWVYDGNASLYVRKDLVEALRTYLNSNTSSRVFGELIIYLVTGKLEGILPPYVEEDRIYDAACTIRVADWPGPLFRNLVEQYNLSNLRVAIAVTDEIFVKPSELQRMVGDVEVEWHAHPHGLLILGNKSIKVEWGKGEIWQALYEIDYINKMMLPKPSGVATGIHTVDEDGMIIVQLIINQTWTDVPWLGERGYPALINNEFSRNWRDKLQPLVTWFATTMATLGEEARSKNPVVAALFSLIPSETPRDVWLTYGSLSDEQIQRFIHAFKTILPSLIDNGYVIGGVIPGITDANTVRVFGEALKSVVESRRVLVTNISYLMGIVRDRYNTDYVDLAILPNKTIIVSLRLRSPVENLPIRIPVNLSEGVVPVVLDKDAYVSARINGSIIYVRANEGYHMLRIALMEKPIPAPHSLTMFIRKLSVRPLLDKTIALSQGQETLLVKLNETGKVYVIVSSTVNISLNTNTSNAIVYCLSPQTCIIAMYVDKTLVINITITSRVPGLASIVAKVWDPADVNGDGIVDYKDLALLGRMFGSVLNKHLYDLRVDINSDGVIDETDLAILAERYGSIVTR